MKVRKICKLMIQSYFSSPSSKQRSSSLTRKSSSHRNRIVFKDKRHNQDIDIQNSLDAELETQNMIDGQKYPETYSMNNYQRRNYILNHYGKILRMKYDGEEDDDIPLFKLNNQAANTTIHEYNYPESTRSSCSDSNNESQPQRESKYAYSNLGKIQQVKAIGKEILTQALQK